MDLTELPVIIVIKAPNQRIGDHTVECMLGWSVKKLKIHLEEVYPSKPKEVHQKLIYSGKLLQDHVLLKDVIRQDNTQTHHTVHLVCSQQESQETIPHPSVSTASPTVNSIPNTDGLRYRNTSTNALQNNYGTLPATHTGQQTLESQMFTHTGFTQEQYMIMMQTYYNQMAAQYMQYYQTGTFPNMANIQMSAPATTTQNEQPQQAQPNDNIRNQQDDVILDARGRVVENVDNDDEFGQHDWLDYIYTFSRFMVLVSIVYFYSNFTRFAIVALFFFIVYLYQTGFFRVRRREPVHQRQQEVQQVQQQQQQNQENDQEELLQDEDSVQQETTTENTPPPEPPKPSVLSVVWSFFSTFFTSLIPQPPPALNGN